MPKEAHIFAEVLEPEALVQFQSAMELDFTVKGALMPDAHTGYTLPIGAVIATDSTVLPAWVGYDIGCGMCALPTSFTKTDVEAKREAIFKDIYATVPVGFNHNRDDQYWPFDDLDRTDVLKAIFSKNGRKQLGTLGGGNHFIEIGYQEGTERVWIIIHSGSRGIGHATATHHMKLASGDGKAREGHFGFRTDSQQGQDYIADLAFCLAFALENRNQIMERVIGVMTRHCTGRGEWTFLINRNHNHAERDKAGHWVHRKGATHAERGMKGVIPGNMRDGSFIVEGLGNPDSLCSSSHGAGRVLGRKAAQRELDLDTFKHQMQGVIARVDAGTLDESPLAYKNIFEVMALQKELVTITARIVPIINIKG